MDNIDELYQLFPEIKEHICVERKVGQGTFSYVYVGYFYRQPDRKVALKYVIPISSPSRTKSEIDCLLNIGGRDNVIGVISVIRNKSHILIIMPYISHVSFPDQFLFWDLEQVRDYIRNLLVALKRVHECGIIHRDVKPSNFLFDMENKIYALVDFGLAQPYDTTIENIFENEKLSRPKSSLLTGKQTENLFSSKNMISVGGNSKQQTGLGSQNSSALSISNRKSINTNTTTAAATTTTTPNFQRYHSFHKTSSHLISDSRPCNCFDTPSCCSFCTARHTKNAPRSGTAGFRPPEVLFRSIYQTPSIDVWSVGVIFLCILSGRYPFFKAADDNIAIMQLVSLFGPESIRKAALKHGESFICSFDKKPLELKELCIRLRKNVSDYMKSSKSASRNEAASRVVCETFPDTAYDLLKRLLDLDCDKRISAADALQHPFFCENS